MVESGGLEIRCTARLYRGFESLSLRSVVRWRGDRVAEGERLESVCTLPGYRGFESPSLRSRPFGVEGQALCKSRLPNPVRSGRKQR